MKSLKIVLASLFLVAGTIAVSSFTVKDFKSNAFAVVCYEFSSAITRDNLNPADVSNFVLLSAFSDQTNWAISVTPPEEVCAGTVQICRVCFDNSLITGTRTFADIMTALHQAITLLPTNGQIYNLVVEGANIQYQVWLEPNTP